MIKPNVLIVDDNPDEHAILKRLLNERFEIRGVFNGQESLRAVKEKAYDLLLLDYSMPGMNGLETLKKLKQEGFGSPVVMFSGQGDEEIATMAMKMGVSDYFIKESVLEPSFGFNLEKILAGVQRKIFINRVAEELLSILTIPELSSHIVTRTKELFEVELCSLMLLTDMQDELYIAAVSGLPEEIKNETRVKINNSISGYVVRTKEPLLVSDVTKDLPFEYKQREKYKTPSFLSLPLLVGNTAIGALNLADKKNGSLMKKDDLDNAIFYLSQTSMAMVIEKTRLLEKSKEEEREKEILAWDINRLSRLSFKLSSSLSVDEIISSLNEEFFFLFSLHTCCILFITESEKILSISTSFSQTPSSMESIKEHIQKKASLFLAGLNIDELHLNLQERPSRKKRPSNIFSCCINLPLVSWKDIIGLIVIAREEGELFSRNDLTILNTIANHAASSLMNAVRFKQLQNLADHDGLTLLLNHRSFYARFSQEIERAQRYNEKLSVLFFDLDNFKGINDKFGHLAGDRVLFRFASLLKGNSRKIDIIGRYGGEEFCIILPEIGMGEAKMVAERIRKDVEKEEFLANGVHITVSCGVASLSEDCQNIKSLIETADSMMYLAKKKGKNRVEG